MIVKVQANKDIGKVYISTKPSHSKKDKEHAINYTGDLTDEIAFKMRGKTQMYFHAHWKERMLILDNEVEEQQW